eukprot:PITA_16152
MLWADVVLCAANIKIRCPSNAIRNKTPYEMWYGHVPSVKHLRVFGSTYYALIPKLHRNKIGARSCKFIFLGYSNTSKAYHLYDEVNKRRDSYTRSNVESSSEELSPSHETPTTDDALSDVIDRIGRLNLDSVPTQSMEQPGPSEKVPPKWLINTLESVHPDEVGNTRTKNLDQQNGGDIYDSNSPVDMDVPYDCELNLSIDFEPTSFKETASHDEWKEAMQKEYDALIKNGTWTLVDPPLGTKPIGCKCLYKAKYNADGSLEKHKARLVTKGFAQKEGVNN